MDTKVIKMNIVPIKRAPQVQLASNFIATAIEDQSIPIVGIVIQHFSKETIKVNITAEFGHVSINTDHSKGIIRVTESIASKNQIVFEGTAVDVNDALKTLQYVSPLNWNSDSNSHDSITVSVNDQGHSGDGGPQVSSKTIDVYVSSVNDAPTVKGPSSLSVDEDETLELLGLCVHDVDSVETYGSVLEVNLTVGHGSLSLSSTAGLFISEGSQSGMGRAVYFRGGEKSVNAAISGLLYVSDANWNGVDSLDISISDLGNTGTGGELTASLNIKITVASVNDAPQIASVDELVLAEEDMGAPLVGLSIKDVDAGEQASLVVSVGCEHGSLSFVAAQPSWITFINDAAASAGVLRFSGSLEGINRALSEISYTSPLNWNSDSNSHDSITVSVNDQGHSGDGD
jgi:hypothetical protein